MKGDIYLYIIIGKINEFFHRQGISLNMNLQNMYNSLIGVALEEETRFLQLSKLIFEYCLKEMFAFNVYF